MSLYFGKHRGKVVNNLDPDNKGRLLVSVPSVLGSSQNWAMPCAPFAGVQSGVYVVPAIGANIWVEFEAGNPERPIWVGGFWGTGETPSLALAPPQPVMHILLETTQQNLLHISDAPGPTGGILIQCKSGATLTINDTGITLTDGKGATISLTGGVVTINQGALVVK